MSRFRGIVRRFRRARLGATMVEFALIAPFFLATMIGILQVSVYLFAQQNLQDAAMQASRYFMTGQAQNGNWTATTIQNQICPQIRALFTCSSVVVIVQNYASFAAANTATPQLYNNGQPIPITSFPFNPGAPGQVMVVQLAYQWSVVGGPLGFMIANLPNSATEIVGVSAFRVEPFL
jgi:Flp pilus assembly protein TadG